MVNLVSLSNISSVNNKKNAPMAFKGYEVDDQFDVKSAKLDEGEDLYEPDKKSMKDLKEARTEFEQIKASEDSPKILKGIANLAIVIVSGVLAGIAFKTTLPLIKSKTKEILVKECFKKASSKTKKTLNFVFKPFKALAKKVGNKLSSKTEAYKASLKEDSKMLKFINKAETKFKGVKALFVKSKDSVEKKALNVTSAVVGASTAAETYEEIASEKEGGR